jgi:lycopene beta-cyclase
VPSEDPGNTYDVAVVGGGGAGLSLILALERAAARTDRPAPSMVLVDPVLRAGTDRTWCWWADGPTPLDGVLHRSWHRHEVFTTDGRRLVQDLADRRYVMLRSADFYRAADEAILRLGVRRPATQVERIIEPDGRSGRRSVLLETPTGTIRARWVFDSRPAAPARPGSTVLLQHFRGWTVRFPTRMLDPDVPTLMDFRVPQRRGQVAFGYCLPLAPDRALVEYTEFSRTRLPDPDYDRALAGYLRMRWDLGPDDVVLDDVEDGVIGMTDAPFARRVGRRTFRLGSAGGATRPATGYTFAAMQRQAEQIAERLVARQPVPRRPVPPRPYPARHRWADAVLLRAIDRGYVPGAELLGLLFEANPPDRLIRFLDGRSSPAEELALMRTCPMAPMARAAIADAAARAARRISDSRPRSVASRNPK